MAGDGSYGVDFAGVDFGGLAAAGLAAGRRTGAGMGVPRGGVGTVTETDSAID